MAKILVKEHDIQKLILEYLTLKRIFHYRNNSGMVFSEYKGKTRAFRVGVVGGPDIVCVINGQYVGIEVKGTNGKQSENQKEFQARLEKSGGKYILTDSLEKLINELK